MEINIGQGLLNAAIFLIPTFVIGMFISMYLWEKTCRTKIKAVVIKTAGGVSINYIPKEGNDVTITNPKTGETRTWPISTLATIGMPYPDLAGLLPKFLQREIQVAFLYEDDWEPVLNKDKSKTLIADPAILGALRQNTIMKALATVSDDLVDSINKLKAQLTRVAGLNPTIIYMGLFASVAVGIAIIVMLMQMDLVSIAEKVNAIYNALGIVK